MFTDNWIGFFRNVDVFSRLCSNFDHTHTHLYRVGIWILLLLYTNSASTIEYVPTDRGTHRFGRPCANTGRRGFFPLVSACTQAYSCVCRTYSVRASHSVRYFRFVGFLTRTKCADATVCARSPSVKVPRRAFGDFSEFYLRPPVPGPARSAIAAANLDIPISHTRFTCLPVIYILCCTRHNRTVVPTTRRR